MIASEFQSRDAYYIWLPSSCYSASLTNRVYIRDFLAGVVP